MYQLCISYTSGDTVVFMKVFFLIFSLFRQIVRHYNSSTIGHRDFRFETLNRLCNNIPHANIYFYVLRTKTVKGQKTVSIYSTISQELDVAETSGLKC